ncbi:MAG: type IIL restriction-modification enzyme MmeI [Isosphaeraceae bacterium]
MGSYVLGMGFTFDDTDTKGVASPITEMHRLIAKDPRNAEKIFPYIGGEEVNDSPTHAHHRYVINFGEMTEQEARNWPDLMRIVEERVNGTRGSHSTAEWWHFERLRPELYDAIRDLKRVLVISRVGQAAAFAFLPAGTVYSEQTIVFADEMSSLFTLLQSRPHEVWARFFASSMKDDMRYTPSDCFETFPFPANFETHPTLESAGQSYYDFRASLMIRNNEGLTKTYNRFHDPDERSPDIFKLCELHAAMDRAVLDAYGWTDLKPACEFLLDYEDEEDQEPATSNQELPTRRRRKPWRYRWPDDFRDEVLARLLELNRQRAEQERLSGAAAEAKSKKPRKTAKKSADAGQQGLF